MYVIYSICVIWFNLFFQLQEKWKKLLWKFDYFLNTQIIRFFYSFILNNKYAALWNGNLIYFDKKIEKRRRIIPTKKLHVNGSINKSFRSHQGVFCVIIFCPWLISTDMKVIFPFLENLNQLFFGFLKSKHEKFLMSMRLYIVFFYDQIFFINNYRYFISDFTETQTSNIDNCFEIQKKHFIPVKY